MNKWKQWLWLAGGALAVMIILVVVLVFRPAKPSTSTPATSTAAAARIQYAALYDTAWRQDSGQGNTLVTATLIAPTMMADLAKDTGRSEAEDQLNDSLQALTDKQLGVFITIDTVSGPLADSAIQKSATLTADGQTFTTANWTPFIGTSNVVNTNTSTSYQSGLLSFTAITTLDWTKLRNLKLVIRGIDSEPDRQYIWAQPQLLLQAQ